jgi:N-acyl-D-aspartate/D-glutamate deacylase
VPNRFHVPIRSALLLIALNGQLAAQSVEYDVIIRNGRILDGTGNPFVYADVVVFDPATIRDKATYFEPFQYSEGISHVLVNGSFVVDGGKPTAAKPGKVLSRQRPPLTP